MTVRHFLMIVLSLASALAAACAPALAAAKPEAARPREEAGPDKAASKPDDKAKAGAADDADKSGAKPDAAKPAEGKDKAAADKAAADKAAKDKAAAAPAPPDPNRVGMIKDFPAGTPDAILREAFRCADMSDEGSGFSCYAAINVDSNHDNDIATAQLRKFQWTYFRKRTAGYVVEGKDTFTLHVTRRDPTPLEAGAKEVKLFLRSRERDNPAPITFRREAGSWRIYANSLGF